MIVIKKRFIFVFGFITLMLGFLVSKLFFAASGDVTAFAAFVGSHERTLTVAKSRGTVYYRDMSPLTNRGVSFRAAVDPMLFTDSELLSERAVADSGDISAFISAKRPFCVGLKATLDADGVYVFKVPGRGNIPAIHTVGYTDENGNGVTGIEKSFNGLLRSDVGLTLTFQTDRARRAVSGMGVDVSGSCEALSRGVVLTLDEDIQSVCDDAADIYIESGAIAVISVKSGEILALSSRPGFSPGRLGEVDGESGAFINRCFAAFNVGSAFKIVDTAAFIENGGSENAKYYCPGSITAGVNKISCQKTEGHGNIGLTAAFADSCNVFFIKAASSVGRENLLDMAVRFGFGKETVFCGGTVSSAGKLPEVRDLAAPAALANFAIGQGELLATPIQIASMVQTVCNGGVRIAPTLIKATVTDNGGISEYPAGAGERVISEKTAELLRKLMIYTVENGSGGRAMPTALGAGVKTATAQTGVPGKLNGWIAGFFPADEPQYAIAVLTENAVSGARSAGPAFKYITDNITMDY